MGAAVGTDEKGSVNVELNIVPFIDLMSCLTAFLLVTAVWVNIAQINIAPKGKTRDQGTPEENPDVQLSILIETERITVGLSRVNEFEPIPKVNSGPDAGSHWKKLLESLQRHKGSAYFNASSSSKCPTCIEIAADSTDEAPVPYQDIIKAMDIAVQAKFVDVGLSDAAGLAARPNR